MIVYRKERKLEEGRVIVNPIMCTQHESTYLSLLQMNCIVKYSSMFQIYACEGFKLNSFASKTVSECFDMLYAQ